ncbi:MAG: response regulator [Candidatus Methylomirabilia bacterium]
MGKARVLIVDDEREFSTTLAERLCLRGYETRAAFTTGEAIAAVGASPPDVVLLDLNLPGGSILLRVERDGQATRVSLHPTGRRAGTAAVPGTAEDEINRELARRLGGTLLSEGGGVTTVRLSPFH